MTRFCQIGFGFVTAGTLVPSLTSCAPRGPVIAVASATTIGIATVADTTAVAGRLRALSPAQTRRQASTFTISADSRTVS